MNKYDYTPVSSCQISGLVEMYFQYFGLIDDGIFVEVGAYDGKTYSNTWQLAKLGWKGLYIEPVPHLCETCRQNHIGHNVDVFEAFVSDTDDGMVAVFDWGGTFTGDADFIHNVVDGDMRVAVEHAKKYTLDTILEKFSIPDNFHLLVIDVEGHELEVLHGFSIDRWNPKIIIIETHAMADHIGLKMHANEIDRIISWYHYVCIYQDRINSIYVRR